MHGGPMSIHTVDDLTITEIDEALRYAWQAGHYEYLDSLLDTRIDYVRSH